MFDQTLKEIMEPGKLLTAPPETTVRQAARRMADMNVGAVLVVENDCLIGIFTERDAVFRVIAMGRDAETTPIDYVMTAAPISLAPDKTYGHALQLMHEHGFRHVPVIECGRPIGIVSSRNVMDPDLEEFVSEERRRRYYSQGSLGQT